MHDCPRCGMSCDCSGDWDDAYVMKLSWVIQNCECDCDGFGVDEDFDEEMEEYWDEMEHRREV